MTEEQKQMEQIVAKMQEYVSTYTNQSHYRDYTIETFILDMVYGIGLSVDDKYKYAIGFRKFKEDFKKELTNENQITM